MRVLNLSVILIFSLFLFACDNELIEPTSNEEIPNLTAIENISGFNMVETSINGEKLHLTENGDYVFQGDILLSQEQIDDFTSNIVTRGAILNQGKYKWADGIVYYSIASGTKDKTKDQIYRAIAIVEQKTMLKFIPRTTHKDYIEFFNGSGCWSFLGKKGGKQQISIDEEWAVTGNVIHEIFHAVGMIHEHSRNDRDNFIIVNFSNIVSAAKSYYEKSDLSQNIIHSFVGNGAEDMDYGSIMMYSSLGGDNAINPNIPVMKKKNGSTWEAQRAYPSIGDIETIGTIYGYRPGVGWID